MSAGKGVAMEKNGRHLTRRASGMATGKDFMCLFVSKKEKGRPPGIDFIIESDNYSAQQQTFTEHAHVQCFNETTITRCGWGHWPTFWMGSQAQGGLPDVPLLEVASVRPQPPWPAGHKDNDDGSDRKVLGLPPPKPPTSPLLLPSLISEKGRGGSAYPGLGRPEGPVSQL